MRVIVCTMFSPSHEEMADLAIPNMIFYCGVHGYDYRIVEVPNNDVWFKKHYSFREYFKELGEGDIIWYRDVDGLIMNINKKITGFVDDEHDIFLTKDFNELNGGSVIWKNTEWGRKINSFIISKKNEYDNEQNVINKYWNSYDWGGKVRVLPHPSINSYQYKNYKECIGFVDREDLGDWKSGNFFIHFPGMSPEKKLEQMLKYKDKIIYE